MPNWLDQLTTSGSALLSGAAAALQEDQHAVGQGTTVAPGNAGASGVRITPT
ncbi:hypothetical protein [Streptomyces syringium]|uniref:hypothetical protein n=1 Tax=Streptomyces syringium TaxID=76729 RepID=UPI0034515923